MSVSQAIAIHGASAVWRQVDLEAGCAERMVALGMPAPNSLGDIFRAQREAYEALTPQERATEDRETRVALDYLGSACKAGVAPRRPHGTRYTA